MKRQKHGFLLLELIVATLILAILGSSLGRIFSKEMELMSLAAEYSEVSRLAAKKMFELELQLKQPPIESSISETKVAEPAKTSTDETTTAEAPADQMNQTGTFSENKKYQYHIQITPLEKYEDLQVLTLTVSGLKQSREVLFTEWVRKAPDLLSKGEETSKNL